MTRTTTVTAMAAIAAAVGFSHARAGAQTIEVVFTEIPTDSSSTVIGAKDLAGQPAVTTFKAMETLALSPDGTQWILKSRNWLGSDLETQLMIGSGLTGAILAQEGQPVDDGAPGELYEFFGSSRPHFNDDNDFVYTARARNGDPTTKQKGIMFDGAFHVVREESDPITGLADAPGNPTGDELFGNSFGSMHILNDGTIGYQDGGIQNIHSSWRPALMYDAAGFRQSNVDSIGGSIWDSFDANDFLTTPDGTRWVAQGDDIELTSIDDILAVDDTVVLREGSVIGGSTVTVAAIFNTNLIGNGDWYSRGDDPADNDWAVRNGTLLVKTGDVVAGAELWGNAIYAFTGNVAGDWALAGNTTGAVDTNEVIVVNGDVVLREGDPVDLDGNGMFDDNVFIGRGNPALASIHPDDMMLTEDQALYCLVRLRDDAGNDLSLDGLTGDAFIRIQLGIDCPEDLNDNGSVDFADILEVIGAWGPCGVPCPQDLSGNGQVDFADILVIIGAWGPC
ncbi:MAG: hypothetical protein GY715_13685 [Planctomycetes bacterium]|nr:hypothetical protein [Planctomycetota bacterium]